MQPLFCGKTTKLGRRAVGMSVMVLLEEGAAFPVQAQNAGGSWEVKVETIADFDYHTAVDQAGNDNPLNDGFTPVEMKDIAHNGSDSEALYGPIGGYLFYGPVSNGFGGLTTRINGSAKFQVKLRWVPDATSPAVKPPTKGALRLTTGASIWGDAAGPITLEVSNASGAVPELAPATPPYRDARGNWLTRKRLDSSGIKLITFENSSANSELTLGPFTSTFNGNATSPGSLVNIPGRPPMSSGAPSFLRLYSAFEAKPDDRSVKLSRGGRYEYSKLENGEWHTYGDSIYSARGVIPGLNVEVPLQINGNRLGTNWSWRAYGTTGTWKLEGFNTPAAVDNYYARGLTQFGTPKVNWTQPSMAIPPIVTAYQGSPTGAQTFTTNCTIVDNGDGATAKAYYHLTLHAPVEKELEDQISTYTIEAPLKNGGTVLGWYGKLPVNEGDPPIEVTSGTSTETGYDVTATVDVSLFKSLLGFSLEGKHSSTKTLSIEQKTTVPNIPAGKYRYLIAVHTFQRRHTFFWKYDEQGKVRRMVTADTSGFVFDPPIEVYHEAFEDIEASPPHIRWSDELRAQEVDVDNLPHGIVPDLPYDYSGGSA